VEAGILSLLAFKYFSSKLQNRDLLNCYRTTALETLFTHRLTSVDDIPCTVEANIATKVAVLDKLLELSQQGKFTTLLRINTAIGRGVKHQLGIKCTL